MKAVSVPMTGDTLYYERHSTGLDIFVWPQPTACSAYAVFGTRYGSVYNTLPTADGKTEEVPEGIAHYLEHKLFESEDVPAFTRFAETGANANAYTSFDRTAYLFQATDKIPESLEVLLDFVQEPYFTEENVQKEQGIIAQEIRMCEDDPDRCVLFELLRNMYRQHPVRIDIAGTVESISHITPELLYRCYRQYYNLHNMALIVAGKITPEEVMRIADKTLKPAAPFQPSPVIAENSDEVVSHYVERSMPVAAPLFHLGFKEPPAPADPKSAAGSRLLLDLLVGKSSPLYASLLERELINDQFGAEHFNGPGFGVWLFGGESKDPRQVEAAIRDEIVRLQRDGIDPERMESVRRAIYGSLVSHMDDTESCGEWILNNVVQGIPPLAELDAIASITAEELTRQIRERIPVEQSTLSVINPE